jgi:hypothetical protein
MVARVIVPKLPPHILAAADQWLAGANNLQAGPLANMREIMAAPDTVNQLAAVGLFIGDRAAGNQRECRELACAYMLALHQLVVVQQKLDRQESR